MEVDATDFADSRRRSEVDATDFAEKISRTVDGAIDFADRFRRWIRGRNGVAETVAGGAKVMQSPTAMP